MPLPLAPIAGFAVRYGAVALASYAILRALPEAPRDQRGEDALDDVSEGLAMRREPEATHGTARLRRVVRLGHSGPGVEIDLTALGRLKLRKLP